MPSSLPPARPPSAPDRPSRRRVEGARRCRLASVKSEAMVVNGRPVLPSATGTDVSPAASITGVDCCPPLPAVPARCPRAPVAPGAGKVRGVVAKLLVDPGARSRGRRWHEGDVHNRLAPSSPLAAFLGATGGAFLGVAVAWQCTEPPTSATAQGGRWCGSRAP